MRPWTNIDMQVTTPLFIQGAKGDTELRASAIRGAMRFWFRALMGGFIGPKSTTREDINNAIKELARVEHLVFGSTDRTCPVSMRILHAPQPRFDRAEMKESEYLMGLGLRHPGPKHKVSPNRPCCPECRGYIPPEKHFTLSFRFPQNADGIAAMTLAALWLTCTYGGIGARTRRGFGGVRIVHSDGPLPEPWTNENLRSPGLEFYKAARFLWPNETIGRCLVENQKDFLPRGASNSLWPDGPPFPILSKIHTITGISESTFKSSIAALSAASKELRMFRANERTRSGRYRTREWRTTIKGDRTDFPIGALGLPVVFDKHREVHACQDNEKLRRASPLWIRPVGARDTWKLFSFAFLGQFLPTEAGVYLYKSQRDHFTITKELETTPRDVENLTRQWIESLRAGQSFKNDRNRRD